MKITYSELSLRPRIFRKLTGLSLNQFNKTLNKISDTLNKEFSHLGRKSIIDTHQDRLLLVLIYYRTYMTQEFLGYLIGIDESNVCRLLSRLEPLIVNKIHIKKDRTLTNLVVEKLLIDATEQPIQRPKNRKRRKDNYSGKKKHHTQKIELTMSNKGQITNVSKIYPGSMHDITIRRTSDKLPNNIYKYCDLGYQGLDKESHGIKLPHKKHKGQKLTKEQKVQNKEHSRIRISIEHKFAEIKKFRILGEKYRNFGKKAILRWNLIAGIVNLQHGF